MLEISEELLLEAEMINDYLECYYDTALKPSVYFMTMTLGMMYGIVSIEEVVEEAVEELTDGVIEELEPVPA